MKCPYCGFEEDKVVDSRPAKEGRAVRRRRECLSCGQRFTTYEYIEKIFLTIAKNDGRRESYDRQKLLQGIVTACKKRPIGYKRIEALVDEIEEELFSLSRREVSSREVGEMVMKKLRELDEVAYVRFASVYRRFKDLSQFMEEMKALLS